MWEINHICWSSGWFFWNITNTNAAPWLGAPALYSKVWGGTQRTPEFIYKNCAFILTFLNFNHFQSTLYLMQYTHWDGFFHCSKHILNLSILSFSASAVFVSPLPQRGNISLWGLFSSGRQKKVAFGKIRWLGRVGSGGHAVFGQKLLNTQCSVGRYTCKSPIVKWANVLKRVFEKIHWSRVQSLTTTPAGALTQMCS